MLTNGNVQQVVKHSMAYGFVLSQPFSFYVDAYPMLQNEVLEESSMLEYGQHNDAVRVLQHKLNTLSYYDKSIDGEFGVLTEYALKQFQKVHQLSVNGKADEQTITKIMVVERAKYLEPLRNIETTYHPGDTGEDIEVIQNALHYFGYYKEDIDGIYGPMTDQALKAFQQDHGLAVEKEVNEKTIDAIYKAETTTNKSNTQQQAPKENVEQQEKTEDTAKNETKKVEKVKSQQNYSTSNLISTAKQFIGTPYLWGGESPGGFDCSGFIQYVFNQVDIKLPRTVTDIWNMTKPVENLSVGDFVFYSTYKAGPSHMGIYVGNGQFIHAGESRGVEVSDMNNSYWKQRYLGAKRVVVEK
ncbi:NlpC/P60 family protein [Aquibacillus koreensis]|uniref:NlpC/P60 family protein n=1 Tax=Aquibacillus koreensis TaxID=279446 RepID=A0A9X3WJX9_9BACI|nr:peptidoglycan-binding protein [Aquibacillus koreensis]MCT2537323.1 NlpC/P60 family protein [Aquibacillus koreensis]MDC3418769.1 NlpC/P60 family protein [Aquibacillus koreensis]